MSETTKNKYTLETLLPLNVSYDRDHILRQQDVDMINILVEVIEGSRSILTPKVGDRMRHVDRDGVSQGRRNVGMPCTIRTVCRYRRS